MNAAPLSLLIIDDSPTDAKLVVAELKRAGRDVTFERVDERDGLRAALGRSWDAVICDWSMPKLSALAALEAIHELGLDLPFIIVSGTIGEEAAVEAMRAGAHDYVLKDKLGRLLPAIEREIREKHGRDERRRAEAALAESEAARRMSEEQLRQAQKIEAVGRLAGGVAHDFNNLLSVILSYAELLFADLAPNDPMRDDVTEIQKAGRRAAELTRQLLMFSRQQVLEPRIIDMNEVLSRMDKMLQRILGEDVDLVTVADPALGSVRVDPGSIEQVIMNLVVNARDAMPTGGKLTMETANVVIDEEYARAHVGATLGPHVVISVTDTGCGMSKTTLGRIFEPFFTTKENGKGTGLGLSTVLGIVQQSGGTIWVYSEEGVGTVVKIYLPRVDATPEETRPRPSIMSFRGTETILLVEDDEQVRLVTRGILRKHGYQVVEARNAGEALLICERHPTEIPLLLTDVVMPQMSGPVLAKRLLTVRPKMKVIYMSGYTDDAAVRHGIIESSVAYLQKPITVDRLTRKVREVLDGE